MTIEEEHTLMDQYLDKYKVEFSDSIHKYKHKRWNEGHVVMTTRFKFVDEFLKYITIDLHNNKVNIAFSREHLFLMFYKMILDYQNTYAVYGLWADDFI